MKREQILALKATFFIVIAIIISCFSLFFWILWDNSIFDFFKDIFYWIFSNKLTTLSAFLSILIISFIIYDNRCNIICIHVILCAHVMWNSIKF